MLKRKHNRTLGRFGLTLLLGLIFTVPVLAQDLDSLMNLNAYTEESDLQKILNKNVSVSTQKLTIRETPGIISLITAEEIHNSGARDLTDVLRLVPGFDIMQDLQFVMGIGLRGSWANEGKVLVMLDGQPLNELLYQSVAVGNRFPVDAIEQIEIIRGPGSAVYGGSAEYGVINIITKAAGTLNGVGVYGTVGLHKDAVGRSNAGFMAAQKGENISWDFSAFAGKSIVSDAMYQDLFQYEGQSDLSESTKANPTNVNLGFRYKNLSLRGMFDRFKTGDPTANVLFQTYYGDASYKLQVSDKLTLTPRIQYLYQTPWNLLYKEDDDANIELQGTRSLGQVDAKWIPGRKVNVDFGALYFQDKSVDLLLDEEMLTLNNFAFYTQALFKHRLANATVGFRFEKNNRYKGAFVPRLALTKKIENLHFKVLYSKSFRSPSLQNVSLDTTGAKPERSNVFEFELGYQFTPEMLLAVNAFHISTKDIIIYGSISTEDTFEEWYESYEKSGSTGIELVYSIRKKNWYANLGYSFSRALSDNKVDIYRVSQTSKQYVGFPAHKVSLNTNINITPKLGINPSFIFAGKRYAYTTTDDEGNPISTELHPYILANVFLYYDDLLPGFNAGLGVYDLLNERPVIPQAYNGGEGAYAPIPGRSREFVIKLSYQLNFKD
jgi:outer membrane receptor for ferrienterochelin and colicin